MQKLLNGYLLVPEKLETDEKPGFFPSRPVFQPPKKPGFLAQSFFCPVHSPDLFGKLRLRCRIWQSPILVPDLKTSGMLFPDIKDVGDKYRGKDVGDRSNVCQGGE